jgi:type II secretory pathway pseudopilin PulG
MRRLASVLVSMALLAGPASLGADEAAVNRTRLVLAIRDYREALETVRRFDEAAVVKARRDLDRRRELLPRGIVALREVAESEVALSSAEDKLEQTQRQILAADHAIMEVLTDPRYAPRRGPPGGLEPGVSAVRYRGFARWSLAEAPKIQSFFAGRFKRPLPVSAYGQTPLHDRMGFDHHDALDVALLPDSAEGVALLAFLRDSGISYLAYRGSVPGEATGAHIHIGNASPRL